MYNFVVYGALSEYYKTVFHDFSAMENVRIRGDLLQSDNRILQLLYKAHTYPRLNRLFRLPGQGFWNRLCFRDDFSKKRPLCFVFVPVQWGQVEYFAYLRKRYPGCKLVIMFRDLIENYERWCPGLTVEKLKTNFDLVMSYNKYDCEKYGLVYFDDGVSYIPMEKAADYPHSDVFFAGLAKERLPLLLDIYEKLTDAGLKCDYYIVNAPENQKKYADQITYTDKPMPYREMLQRTVNARCVLEVSQENACGFTSRMVEAIMYNKKLLTNSVIAKEIPFYRPDRMQFFETAEQINLEFLKNEDPIDYGYVGEYSPVHFLEQIERIFAEQKM